VDSPGGSVACGSGWELGGRVISLSGFNGPRPTEALIGFSDRSMKMGIESL
jgi:hypothetical protein